jgi:rRNA processing protein Krr1/Pno1
MVASSSSQRDKSASRRRWALSVSVLLLLSALLGLLVVVLSRFALLMLALVWPEIDARAAVAEALASILGNIPLIGNALSALAGNLGLARWLEPNLGTAALVMGFLIGLAILWSRSCNVAAHLFLPLDETVALPFVPPAHALEPLRPTLLDDPDGRPMFWVEPREGQRKDVWLGLADFALAKGAKFEYQLLLGGPGAGKTRMAIEFARRVLAKKGATDDGPFVIHGPDNHDVLMTRAQRLRSWWRIRVLGLNPRPEDIWHIGWFSPEALARSSGRLMIRGQLASRLDAWRPTGPTFLLLDDPLLDDSVFVVETLLKNAGSFRHRVRLLIANQTVPGDLRFSRVGQQKAWQSQVHPPFADPLVLSANGPLSDGEIRLLAGQLPTKLAQPILSDAGLRDFRMVTRGNPFLVELGLAWLNSGKPLLHMTEEGLLEDRTRRFLEAVRTAGFEAGQGQLVDLLTMATIANGAPTTLPAGHDGETVWDIFGVQRIDQQNAARLFPADTDIDLRQYLPPMRPEAIATAFARMAIADLAPVDQNRIIRTAWRANPRGTLRTLLRIDGGYKFRTDQKDPLQSAFVAVPMQSGLPPFDMFCLLAQASCSASLQDWEDGKYHLGASLLDNAIGAARDLPGDTLPRAFHAVVDLILADRSTRMLRETGAARLLMEILPVIDRAGRLFDPLVLDDLSRWAQSPRALGHDSSGAWEFGSGATLQGAPASGTTTRLLDLIAHTSDKRARILLCRVMHEAAAHEPALQDAGLLRDASVFMTLAEETALSGGAPGLQHLQSGFPELLARARPHGRLALSIISAFMGALVVGGADDRGAIPALAEDAATLAASLPNDTAVQRLLASIWCQAAYATVSDLALCRLMAERVEAIAQGFPEHEGIQEQHATAWAHVAFATKFDPAECHKIAERVEAIALCFPDHETIQSSRAEAWLHVASATTSDPGLCHRSVERIETIARTFPDHTVIQRVHALAWLQAAVASQSNPLLRRQIAERVDTISRPFPEDVKIQQACALTWRFVVHETKSDAALCQRIAERVDSIARPFPDDETLQLLRADAWRTVATATMSDPALCRRMAERVEAVAKRFPGNERLQKEHAETWRLVAHATRSDAALCREMAARVEAIARDFPDHEGIQLEHAIALRVVAFATPSNPDLCRQMAERVEAIALRFPDNMALQRERADAWANAAYAARSDPDLCRQMVERVEAIARSLPEHEGIQKEARLARSYLPHDAG